MTTHYPQHQYQTVSTIGNENVNNRSSSSSSVPFPSASSALGETAATNSAWTVHKRKYEVHVDPSDEAAAGSYRSDGVPNNTYDDTSPEETQQPNTSPSREPRPMPVGLTCVCCHRVIRGIQSLIRVYDTTTWPVASQHHRAGAEDGSTIHPTTTTRTADVCDACLLGYTVPVRRRSGLWECGTVHAYNTVTKMHHLVFRTTDDTEWVYVMDDPYDSYVQQYSDVYCPNRDDGGVLRYAIDTVDPVLAFVKNATWDTTQSAIYDSDAVRLDSIINVYSTKKSGTPIASEMPPFLVADPQYCHSPVIRRTQRRQLIELHSPIRRTRSIPTRQAPTANSPSSRTTGGGPHQSKLWTSEEDRVLLQQIAAKQKRPPQHPPPSSSYYYWPTIADAVPNRTAKQCRERYVNHLTSTLKKSDWTELEDATLVRLYHVHGTNHYLKRQYEKQQQQQQQQMERMRDDKSSLCIPTISKNEQLSDVSIQDLHAPQPMGTTCIGTMDIT